MKSENPNHLKAWREHRRLTQEQLAELIGTTGSVISLLESGDRRLSDKWLRRLAPALNSTPGHLLDYTPEDVPSDLFEIWASIPDDRKAQAMQVLSTFRKAG